MQRNGDYHARNRADKARKLGGDNHVVAWIYRHVACDRKRLYAASLPPQHRHRHNPRSVCLCTRLQSYRHANEQGRNGSLALRVRGSPPVACRLPPAGTAGNAMSRRLAHLGAWRAWGRSPVSATSPGAGSIGKYEGRNAYKAAIPSAVDPMNTGSYRPKGGSAAKPLFRGA
jgi:hypothetical protein